MAVGSKYDIGKGRPVRQEETFFGGPISKGRTGSRRRQVGSCVGTAAWLPGHVTLSLACESLGNMPVLLSTFLQLTFGYADRATGLPVRDWKQLPLQRRERRAGPPAACTQQRCGVMLGPPCLPTPEAPPIPCLTPRSPAPSQHPFDPPTSRGPAPFIPPAPPHDLRPRPSAPSLPSLPSRAPLDPPLSAHVPHGPAP